jgi:uncharacterized protein (DUF1499 family)
MDPIQYQSSVEGARRKILQIVRDFSCCAVVEDRCNYLKVEVRSAVVSLVDEVEFEFDDAAKVIHFRSTSSLDNYDFCLSLTCSPLLLS